MFVICAIKFIINRNIGRHIFLPFISKKFSKTQLFDNVNGQSSLGCVINILLSHIYHLRHSIMQTNQTQQTQMLYFQQIGQNLFRQSIPNRIVETDKNRRRLL